MKSKLNQILILTFIILPFYTCIEATKYTTRKATKENEVTVETDKMEYNESEFIKLVFINNTSDSIYSHFGSHTPNFSIKFVEKRIDKNYWKQYFSYCLFPKCQIDIDVPVIVKPAQQIKMEWMPILFSKRSRNGKVAKCGTYRVLIQYLDSDKSIWHEVYSNEFQIK